MIVRSVCVIWCSNSLKSDNSKPVTTVRTYADTETHLCTQLSPAGCVLDDCFALSRAEITLHHFVMASVRFLYYDTYTSAFWSSISWHHLCAKTQCVWRFGQVTWSCFLLCRWVCADVPELLLPMENVFKECNRDRSKYFQSNFYLCGFYNSCHLLHAKRIIWFFGLFVSSMYCAGLFSYESMKCLCDRYNRAIDSIRQLVSLVLDWVLTTQVVVFDT